MAQIIGAERSRFKRYWEQQAIQCAADHRWAEAEKINRSIVKLDPQDVDARNRLGKALWELGLLQEAKLSYQHALELDPVNAIAGRNLVRLESWLEAPVHADVADDVQRVPADIFIAEPGKTKIVKALPVPGKQSQALPLPGDPLRLERRGSVMRVLSRSGQPLGQLAASLSQRLIYLIESGNRYAAAVLGIQSRDVYVVIKETYQHPSQAGQHSFPGENGQQLEDEEYWQDVAPGAESDFAEESGDAYAWADLEGEDIDAEGALAVEDDF